MLMLIMGAGLFLAGLLTGIALTMRLRPVPVREVPMMPSQLAKLLDRQLCGCGHHKAFHSPSDGACRHDDGIYDNTFLEIKAMCKCQRFLPKMPEIPVTPDFSWVKDLMGGSDQSD